MFGMTTGGSAKTFGEIFTIPESQGDTFVLKLGESVTPEHIQETLESYVVTDSIAANLRRALGFVHSALESGNNQGVYLTGNFGSGKSHFMAVLYALFSQTPEARQVEELQPIIAENEKLTSKRFLQLTTHFLGSDSVEERLFSSILNQLATQYPDAALPRLREDAFLFEDASNLRSKMGDEKFFSILNQHESETKQPGTDDALSKLFTEISGGGAASTTWSAETYDVTVASGDLTQRKRLAETVEKSFFPSRNVEGRWLGLSDGLYELSKFGAEQGYDAIVLYLDELILWLMFMVADPATFAREVQKLTLLVESDQKGFPIPVISFVARQRDLSTWVDSSFDSGSTLNARQEALAHQEGRFHNIVLGEKNLPEIAHKRLLTPRDEAARQDLVSALAKLQSKPDVLQTLLDGENTSDTHQAATYEQFKLTYPFSPALVDTLVHLSAVMQRERTALKVMENLLIQQRNTGTIDKVIPVGDAFEELVTSSDSTEDSAQERFSKGRAFWYHKLRPVILRSNDLEGQENTPDEELPGYAQADLRLGKTLVLSALAPNVPALKNLTAPRLAALNHGSITTLFSSDATTRVLTKAREWSTFLPEVRVQSDSANPIISLVIDEVPWEDVMNSARSVDTPKKRRERIRDDLRLEFGVANVDPANDGSYQREVVWRGTKRTVDVIFGNVRSAQDLPVDRFVSPLRDTLRFVVDYPFDEAGHTPADDHARLEEMKNVGAGDRFTVVWIPQFFNQDSMTKLGNLVVAEHITAPGRLGDYTQRIAADQADAVRERLNEHKENLSIALADTLRTAYGIKAGSTFPEGQAPLKSLDQSLDITIPSAPTLAAAVDRVIQSALDMRYPEHPKFGSDRALNASDFNRALDYLRKAATAEGGRADIDVRDRAVARGIINPLGLGQVHDTHLVFDDSSAGTALSDIDSSLRRQGFQVEDTVTVQAVREAVERVHASKSLNADTVDLFVGAWAAMNNRSWYRHQVPVSPVPAIGKMDRDMELRPIQLPDRHEWNEAIRVYALLSGDPLPPILTGDSLQRFHEQAREFAGSKEKDAASLVAAIRNAMSVLGAQQHSRRLELAEAIQTFLSQVTNSPTPTDTVRLVASHGGNRDRIFGFTNTQANTSIAKAEEVIHELKRVTSGDSYFAVEEVLKGRENGDETAERIVEAFAKSLSEVENARPIRGAVDVFLEETSNWIKRQIPAKQDLSRDTPTTPMDSEQAPPAVVIRSDRVATTVEVDATTSTADIEAALQQVRNSLGESARYRIVVERITE